MESKEFELLGFNVRLSEVNENNGLDPQKVLNYVTTEVEKIKETNQGREQGELAILLALKLAADKLRLEAELREDINRVQSTAIDALHLIEEVSPTTF